MYLSRHEVTVTTNASGDGTGYTSGITEGLIRAIRYVKTDYANGVDVTITCEVSGQAILTWTDQNSSDTSYPRAATNDVIDAASLYASGGEPVETLIPVANERIKVVVAQGGDTKTGTFHIYVG